MNLDYLAGIVDGEGTISIAKSGHGKGLMPYISIANTNLKLIEEISGFLKSIGVGFHVSKKQPRKSNHQVSYSLNVRYNHAIKLAELLRWKLVIKSEQARMLIEDYKKCTPRNGKYNKEQLEMKSKFFTCLQSLNHPPIVAIH